MKLKPKKFDRKRFIEIEKMIGLSKEGKRLQELPAWEEAVCDCACYCLHLKQEKEVLEAEVEKLKREIEALKNKHETEIDNLSDSYNRRITGLERDWARKEGIYQRDIGKLRTELAQCKAKPR